MQKNPNTSLEIKPEALHILNTLIDQPQLRGHMVYILIKVRLNTERGRPTGNHDLVELFAQSIRERTMYAQVSQLVKLGYVTRTRLAHATATGIRSAIELTDKGRKVTDLLIYRKEAA